MVRWLTPPMFPAPQVHMPKREFSPTSKIFCAWFRSWTTPGVPSGILMETVVELSAPKTTPSETRYAAAIVRTVLPYLKVCIVDLCNVPPFGHILSKPPEKMGKMGTELFIGITSMILQKALV